MIPQPQLLILRHARLATLAATADDGYGLIEDAALVADKGRIVWLGADQQLPADFSAELEIDAEGRLLTPGLIDCHTHLVWGGDRVREFEQRLEGVSYQEIARQGGGIVSTVRATRKASDQELYGAAERRLGRLAADGVTTVEVKSGYGLDTATERRLLQVARRLGREQPMRVHTTFLGAHAVPPELTGRDDDYIEMVCRDMLPRIAAEGLADAVDGFCEGIAFSPAQIERVFQVARGLGLPVKLHAEQLSCLGGAALAARYGALSVDHLEYLDEVGVRALADTGTVAVLLPGAFYFLHETQLPPVELLRRHGVPIAVATDLNPGSSPISSLLVAMNMAAVLFALTPAEVLAAVTRHAARALGVAARLGTLEVGKEADLALWNVAEPAALVANLGQSPLATRFLAGRPSTVEPGKAWR